ncbi:MAG: hypothetical protein GOV00_02870, partial [Candidatus Altiarchaeota archaeon]|nr:hypothetical protein [Candidatus Altiarchaeota archaeon]
MAMNALPQKVSYTSGEAKREAGLHSGGEIPVALIDKYIYLVLGESFADVHEADGVVSGALQYAEDVVLDVWSF